MPTTVARKFELSGLGNVEAMGDSEARGFVDCDKIRTIADGTMAAPWGGCNRVGGAKISDATYHGAAGNRIDLVRLPETWVRKPLGHVLAAIDRNSLSDGRVLAAALHGEGIAGSQLVSEPFHSVGTGLNDLETDGVWTDRTTSGVFLVTIDGTTPDTFKWSNDAGATWEAEDVAITGAWQTLEGGAKIKFGATTGHTAADAWVFTGGPRPSLAGTMNRQGAQLYPAMAGAKGKLLVMHGYDKVLVDDGTKIREAGLRSPQIKPTLGAATVTDDLGDIGQTDDDPCAWVAMADGVDVSRITTDPAPADGTASVKISPPYKEWEHADLAYVNHTGTLTTAISRIRFWLWYNAFRDHTPKDGIKIVFCSDVAGGGTRRNYQIGPRLACRKWHKLDLAVQDSLDGDLPEGGFAYKSVVFRIVKEIEFKRAGGFDRFFAIDGLIASLEADTLASETFSGKDKWQFVFTWLRSSDGAESAPSPISDPIILDGHGVDLDLAGEYALIDSGLLNSPPDGADAVHIYVFKEAFGNDSRTGGGQFFRLSPPAGYPMEVLQNVFTTVVAEKEGGNTGDGTLTGVEIIGDLPDQTITVTATEAGPEAAFTVVGSLAGSLSDAESGGDYKSADDVIRFSLSDGTTPYAAGDVFTIEVTREARDDGKLMLRLCNPISSASITAQPRIPFYNRQVQPGNVAIADGNLIVIASQPPYSVGSWTWTDTSHVITPVASGDAATTPIVGQWMEGRKIRRDGETTTYFVLKALDQNADGVFDALWIARDFDVEKQAYVNPYDGTTGTAAATILGDEQSIWWTNNSAEAGVDVESSSILNQLKVMPDGDRIVGGGKSGEFLWICGSKNSLVLKQDPGALADEPSLAAYSNPLHLPNIGMISRRAWVSMPDGSAFFISTRGELVQVAGSQYQLHASSPKLQTLLGGYGLLASPDKFGALWITLNQSVHGQYLYIGLPSGNMLALSTGDIGPGVTNRAQNEYRLTTTQTTPSDTEEFIDWSEINPATETLATLNGDASPVEAFDQGAIGDMNDATQDAAIAAFPRFSNRWQTVKSGVVCSRVLSVDSPPNDDYIASKNDPEFVLCSGTTGGVGLPFGGDPDAFFFQRGFWSVGVHRIVIPNTLTPGDTLDDIVASYSYVYWGGAGCHNLIPNTGSWIRFKMRFSGTGTIPANTFAIGYSHEYEGTSWAKVPIDMALPAGEWVDVWLELAEALEAPDGTPVEGYFPVNTWHLFQTSAIDPELYTEGEITLDFANGRTCKKGGGETTTVGGEPFSFTRCADPAGSTYSTAAVGDDFEIGILVDLARDQVFLGSECRFTCNMGDPASGCNVDGSMLNPLFFGDRDGFLVLALDDRLLTWGSPMNRFVLALDADAPGDASTLRLAASETAIVDTGGTGLLLGLLAAKVTPDPATIEFRRVTSNTSQVITVDSAWTTAPAVGDLCIIAPLVMMAQWIEARRQHPAVARSATLNLEREITTLETSAVLAAFTGMLTWDIFTAAGRDNQADMKTAAASVSMLLDRLERGKGVVYLGSNASKALAYRLSVVLPQTGTVKVRGIVAAERQNNAEGGR